GGGRDGNGWGGGGLGVGGGGIVNAARLAQGARKNPPPRHSGLQSPRNRCNLRKLRHGLEENNTTQARPYNPDCSALMAIERRGTTTAGSGDSSDRADDPGSRPDASLALPT